jgi:hypothetical protein
VGEEEGGAMTHIGRSLQQGASAVQPVFASFNHVFSARKTSPYKLVWRSLSP